MNATILRISNATNTLMDNYQIGNILNKNLLIRNMALMRNIGKYSMYEAPLFPEIGMAYNVYEHLLNRPEDIGFINGLIGYNNGFTDDGVLAAGGDEARRDFMMGGNIKNESRFRTATPSSDSDATTKKKKKGQGGDNLTKSEANTNNSKPTVQKTVYVTNSHSAELSGGDIMLGIAMSQLDKQLSDKPYIPDEFAVSRMSIERPFLDKAVQPYALNYNIKGVYERDLDTWHYGTYQEGEAYSPDRVEKELNTTVRTEIDFNSGETDYAATTNGYLFNKTNKLFHEGKIGSLIARFYATEQDPNTGKPIYLSRGRNLHKKGELGKHDEGAGGYDNPYCRVWTIHHQYNKITDTIRPRYNADEERFYTLQEIQAPYGEGLRPYGGATRLSNMSVLKPNGFVNITPHQTESGELDKESVKKCMFSIENLAWKDVQIKRMTTTKNYKKNTTGKPSKDDLIDIGGTLSDEQIGPNGGRIMWFPPYNLKFSEDVTTNWNSNTFIGRGENMYTYVNTERGGSLSFTLLIDHPSVVDKWTYMNPDTDDYEREEKILRFFAGCDDIDDESTDPKKPKSALPEAQAKPDVNPKEAPQLSTLKSFVFFPNNYSGKEDSDDDFVAYLLNGKDANRGYEVGGSGHVLNTPLTGVTHKWYYKVDSEYQKKETLRGYSADTGGHGGSPSYANNNVDRSGFTLNKLNQSTLDANDKQVWNCMKKYGFVEEGDVYGKNFFSFQDLKSALESNNTNGPLNYALNGELSKHIYMIEFRGYASYHGHPDNNEHLSSDRAKKVLDWLRNKKGYDANILKPTNATLQFNEAIKDTSCLDAKVSRSVVIIFHICENMEAKDYLKTDDYKEKKVNLDKLMYKEKNVVDRTKVIHDNEYLYFKELNEKDSLIKSRTIEKVKYFDPAFHSITPEGFNARLTFLQQCTRQGPTHAASDTNSTTKDTGVGNLAFGRAPYCVLRIGDFYNTKILIDNISISYDSNGGVQWDLNPEGIGVQPIMADVNIRFKFIGGSDISGPIERLQNAVSFNYYSNTSIYERRADYRGDFIGGTGDTQVRYWDARTQGNNDKGTR